MSQFNYNDYQNVVAQAEANGNSSNSTKIGYFKLKDDGDIAIARLNIGSTDDLMFASVHTLGINGKWIKVNCLNPLGSYGSTCALCTANASNPKGSISKAVKKVFIPMLVSYRDAQSATGYTQAAPVIWDRPAAFSRELANKLMASGDLRNTLVLITRNGKAGDMQTTYSMDILPADHPVFKPEMIPTDFSAFQGFNIAKHSYWEKTPEEINTFLTTGKFPGDIQQPQNDTVQGAIPQAAMSYGTPPVTTTPAYVTPTPAAPVAANPAAPAPLATQVPNTTAAPIPQAPIVESAPAAQAPVTAPYAAPATTVSAAPTVGTEAPARNFSGFSF